METDIHDYVNMHTKERVAECDALNYVLNKLEIRIKENELNMEQVEFKEMIVDWYFSGNWIKEEIKEGVS